MRYTITFLLAACAVMTDLYAQQLPLYSQYYFTKFMYNPAFAGDQEKAEATLIGRRQWDGVPGYSTNALALSGVPANTNVGLGLHVINDNNQLVRTNSVYGSYAYRLKMGSNSMLALSMALGMVDTRFNTENIIVTDYNDPVIPLLGQKGGPVIDANFGLNLKAGGFQLGFALPQAFTGRQKFSDNYERVINHDLAPHYIATASFDIWLSKDKLKLQPLVMYKGTKNAPAQIDGNLVLDWVNKGWLGLGYRDEYAVTISGGLQVGKILRVGYSYDYSIHEQSAALGSTHELMLGVSLSKKDHSEEDSKKEKAERARQAMRDSFNNERISMLEEEIDELKKSGGTKDTVVIVQQVETVVKERVEPDQTQTPPKDTKPVVSESGTFMVVAGAFSEEKNAKAYVSKLKNQGQPAAVYKAPNGTYYVHLGRFNSKDEARKVVKDNKSRELQLWIKTL